MRGILSLLFLLQGIPVPPQQGGTISGVLRDAAGRPATGVRVAAVAVPQSPTEAVDSSALASLAETDTTIPLAPLRGKVVDQVMKEPLQNGMVFLNGGVYGTSQPLREDGTFEFPRLLPGSYTIEVQPFAHDTVKRAVVVTDDGSEVQIEAAENRR